MHSFPANKVEVVSAKVEALVAVHTKALVDAETEVKALEAKVLEHAATIVRQAEQLARHEAQLARSVLRRVLHWLTHYEGLV